MIKNIKYFVLGVVFTVITIMSLQVFADNIEVMFDSIKIKVDGNDITKTNILYKGTTYVPLRAIGEILDKDVVWDGDTRTANINTKKVENPIVWSNITIKTEYSYTKAYGEVKNNDNIEHSFSLKITYFDESGTIMGTGQAYLNNLKAGETKTFEAGALKDYSKYKTYKIQLDNLY